MVLRVQQAQQARQVTAPHDGYIVEINVKAGDSYDGKTAALVISSEGGDAVLRADTSKIEKKIDKGTQVTVKRDSDKTLTKKVTDSGVEERVAYEVSVMQLLDTGDTES